MGGVYIAEKISGSLPAGLSLNGNIATIHGTPTTEGDTQATMLVVYQTTGISGEPITSSPKKSVTVNFAITNDASGGGLGDS
jgi:hypothetical protein